MRRDAYRKDTLNGSENVDFELEDMLDEIAVETPTDNELAKLQEMLSSDNGIAEFLSDM